MNLSGKKIYIFGAIAIILALVIIVYFLQGIIKDSQELLSQKTELVLFELRSGNLENLQKQYKDNQGILEKVDISLVDAAFPIGFVSFVRQSVPSPQDTIKISSTKEIEGPEPALSLGTTFSGSFPNLLKFIDRLENGPYLIEIINLNVKRLGQQDLSGNITANLELIVLSK